VSAGRKKVRRGPAVAFVSKTRVRRFIEVEKLIVPSRGVPMALWPLLEECVRSKVREELSRGQMPLPLEAAP
jgi:hypothetical protein